MSKLRLLMILGVYTVVLPTMAAAGNGTATGSCLWLYSQVAPAADSLSALAPSGDFDSAECIDGFAQEDCSAANVQWSAESCADLDLPFNWDGSCYVPQTKLGEVCVLVWTDPQSDLTSQQRCENAPTEPAGGSGNSWFDDLVWCCWLDRSGCWRPGTRRLKAGTEVRPDHAVERSAADPTAGDRLGLVASGVGYLKNTASSPCASRSCSIFSRIRSRRASMDLICASEIRPSIEAINSASSRACSLA
jgi:hypothetical protein